MEKKELAMNGAGVAELGFPMWPQFDPKTKEDIVKITESGLVSYWTGKVGMEFEEKFRAWSGATMAISCATGTAALHIAISSLGTALSTAVLLPPQPASKASTISTARVNATNFFIFYFLLFEISLGYFTTLSLPEQGFQFLIICYDKKALTEVSAQFILTPSHTAGPARIQTSRGSDPPPCPIGPRPGTDDPHRGSPPACSGG